MLGDGTGAYGRIPVRVLLRGEPAGWHYEVVDEAGGRDRVDLAGGGTRWQTGSRRDAEPPWWPRRLAEVAEGIRELVGQRLTDHCFAYFGGESDIAWFAVDDPISWEGLVTLRDPDPARFPGKVPPYVVSLEPGRGVLLPEANLLFDTLAPDAWTALAAVAESCGAPSPKSQFLCGWAGHQAVRVGRGLLAVSTVRHRDGAERVGEIYAERGGGWGGNPELHLRLDGIELLHDPAEDVVWLLQELGHKVVEHGRTRRLPAIGLTLYVREGIKAWSNDPFGGVSLRPPGLVRA